MFKKKKKKGCKTFFYDELEKFDLNSPQSVFRGKWCQVNPVKCNDFLVHLQTETHKPTKWLGYVCR